MKQHGGARKGAGRPKGQGQYGEPTKPVRVPLSLLDQVSKLVVNKGYKLPLFGSKVAAGLPAFADEHVENHLDLNDYLIRQPSSTFLVRVSGHSMIGAGINEDDLLIVDSSLEAAHGKIVVAALDGQLTVKRLHNKNNKLFLQPENKNFSPIEITQENDIHVLGVVTNVIHAV